MGLPEVQCAMRWMVDSSDFFQLEFFEFQRPHSKPGSRRPDDTGWTMVGLNVADLAAVTARLRKTGVHIGPTLVDAAGPQMCCQDPEGVWLEIRQQGAAGPRMVRDVPVTTAFVRAVVPDLERSRKFFSGALGLRDSGIVLHNQDDEKLWDASPADTRTCVLRSASAPLGCAVELVEYTAREARPQPADYRISDQGLLNVAFGSRNPADYQAVSAQVQAGAYTSHQELAIGPAASRYLVDDQSFSVELLTIPDPNIERDFGFDPRSGNLGHVSAPEAGTSR